MKRVSVLLLSLFVASVSIAQTIKPSTLDSLQGKWQTLHIKNGVVEIKGHEMTLYDKGQKLGDISFGLSNNCHKDSLINYKEEDNGRYIVLYIEGDSEFISCNEIERLTGDILLTYIRGGQNIGKKQQYKRVKQ